MASMNTIRGRYAFLRGFGNGRISALWKAWRLSRGHRIALYPRAAQQAVRGIVARRKDDPGFMR